MRSESRPLPRPGGRVRSAARVPEGSRGQAAAAARSGPDRAPRRARPAGRGLLLHHFPAPGSDGRAPGRAAPQPALAPRPEEPFAAPPPGDCAHWRPAGVRSAGMPKVRRRQPRRGASVCRTGQGAAAGRGRVAEPPPREMGGAGAWGGHRDTVSLVVAYFRLFLLESCFKFKTEKLIKRHFKTH